MSSTIEERVAEISIAVPWGEIRGKSWGPDHGYPVLCLHGWADNCGSFDSLIPYLPKECRYVAVDLAGHGLSSHRAPGVFYSFPAYVADVLRIAEGLQWTKFSIIGHSMGGNIGNMFSALYPERVDVVVLLDIFGFMVTPLEEMTNKMRQGLEEMIQFEKNAQKNNKTYTYEKAMERLLAVNPMMSERSARILLKRGLTPVEGGFQFSRDLRVNFKFIVRYNLRHCLELLSKIQASVLVILADQGYGKPSGQQKYAELLQAYRDRNHTVVTVPGDHHVHLNNPEGVASLISDLLQTKVIPQQLPE